MFFKKSLLAAVLAPLAVSAVPVRRGVDPNTLLVLREYLRRSRSLDSIRGLMIVLRVCQCPRTAGGHVLHEGFGEIPVIGFR
jgi:hypothetical protein